MNLSHSLITDRCSLFLQHNIGLEQQPTSINLQTGFKSSVVLFLLKVYLFYAVN